MAEVEVEAGEEGEETVDTHILQKIDGQMMIKEPMMVNLKFV